MKTEYLLIGAGAAVVLYLATVGKKAAAAVGDALNITKDTNLAARGVNAVGEAVTGDPAFSLGVKAFEKVTGDTSSEALKYWNSQPAGSHAKDAALRQTAKTNAKAAKPPATNLPKKPGTGGITVLPAQGPTTGDGWLIPATVVGSPFYY